MSKEFNKFGSSAGTPGFEKQLQGGERQAPTYTYNEIFEIIETANVEELKDLIKTVKDEHTRYLPIHLSRISQMVGRRAQKIFHDALNRFKYNG